MRPYGANFEQGQGRSSQNAAAEHAPRLLDVRGGQGGLVAHARNQAGVGQGVATFAKPTRLAQNAVCAEDVDGLLDGAGREIAVAGEFPDGDGGPSGACQKDMQGDRFARVDDGAVEKSMQKHACPTGAFVSAQGR